ncbi:MAG: sporulation protein YabP [Oscillospiraceae bacterium]|nr:sporulation protein YabP [Oscillospiraceae bacterium]
MTYDEKSTRPQTPHHIILEGRAALSVSGVEEVERFDDSEIVMYTSCGTLIVRGNDLHIEKLSLEGGDLKVAGTVEALLYEDEGREKGGGLFSHLFR